MEVAKRRIKIEMVDMKTYNSTWRKKNKFYHILLSRCHADPEHIGESIDWMKNADRIIGGHEVLRIGVDE